LTQAGGKGKASKYDAKGSKKSGGERNEGTGEVMRQTEIKMGWAS